MKLDFPRQSYCDDNFVDLKWMYRVLFDISIKESTQKMDYFDQWASQRQLQKSGYAIF